MQVGEFHYKSFIAAPSENCASFEKFVRIHSLYIKGKVELPKSSPVSRVLRHVFSLLGC